MLITQFDSLNAQSISVEEMGSLGLGDVRTSNSIDGRIIVPALANNEGILIIQLGKKLQAFLRGNTQNSEANLAIQLGRDIELLTEKKSIRFPQESTFQVRFKGYYVGKQASSRPTIQINGVSDFSTYKDVIRLYKQKVNTVILEIDTDPIVKNMDSLNNTLSTETEMKQLKSKRKKIFWLFITSSILGTAYVLSQDRGSGSSADFPTPPNRPNN